MSNQGPIKINSTSAMSLTEGGWKIMINNADGTSDEVMVEVLQPKKKTKPKATGNKATEKDAKDMENVEKDGGDVEEPVTPP
jgi:hypothetical protein